MAGRTTCFSLAASGPPGPPAQPQAAHAVSQHAPRQAQRRTHHHGVPPPPAPAHTATCTCAPPTPLLRGGAPEVDVNELRLAREGRAPEPCATSEGGDEEAVADGVVEEAALALADEVRADDDRGGDGEEEDERRCAHISARSLHGTAR
ncbi:hypothetical protein FOMPIDRAFT_1026553 [Fomitopsis schrenkii]|uniref:Uncharacterized protein n=1 Tax=Fomitopsis schrenkii TaxID=2126942 RepID=S8DKW3_FOMSC|nr:hypothetical protein FOMPIDRAFT_1026553 [Fomitopsis schrenkii]